MSDVRRVGALTLLLIATGGQMAAAQSPSPLVTATESSSAAGARLRVGQELDVRLGANSTTGFTWRFQPDPPLLLQPTARRFEPSAAGASPLPGAGGVQVFAF